MKLLRFESPAAAGAALAGEVAQALGDALDARDAASLAVPGGRTPLPFFHALRAMPLEFRRVAVTLTDERCVPVDDADSNEALVRAQLLQHHAAAAQFLPLRCGDADGALTTMPLPFDAVVLGMGEDGHFASLFPGSSGLDAALDLRAAPGCVAMQAPSPPVARISLNLAALAHARRLFLFVTGAAKRSVLEQAAVPSQASQWPVGALLALRQPQVEVYWAP